MLYVTLLATLLLLGQAQAGQQYKSKWWRGKYLSWTKVSGDIPENVEISYYTGGNWERFAYYEHCTEGNTWFCILPTSGYFRVNLEEILRVNFVRVKYFAKESTTTEEWPRLALWDADNQFVNGNDISTVSNIWPFEDRNFYADQAYQACGENGQAAYDHVLEITDAVESKKELEVVRQACADGTFNAQEDHEIPDEVKAKCSSWTDAGDGVLTCTGDDGKRYRYSRTCD